MKLPLQGTALRKVLDALKDMPDPVTVRQGMALHGPLYGRTALSVRNAYDRWVIDGWMEGEGGQYMLSEIAANLLKGERKTPTYEGEIVPCRTANPFRELTYIPSRDYNAIRPGSADLLPANHGVYRRA